MFECTPQNREAVIRCRDTVREIAMSEKQNIKDNLSKVIPSEGKTAYDHHETCVRLRYLLFQCSLGDAFQHLNAAVSALEMSDEELDAMCASSGETVKSALQNTMSNMMMDILMSAMRGNTPPPSTEQ